MIGAKVEKMVRKMVSTTSRASGALAFLTHFHVNYNFQTQIRYLKRYFAIRKRTEELTAYDVRKFYNGLALDGRW